MTNLHTLSQALTWALAQLDGGESPKIDSQVLLLDVIKQNQTYLYTWPDKQLTAEQQQQFERSIERRKQGEPVAHITGSREFWSLPFKVSSATLIPRPDTEVLVETALGFALPSDARVLDLGTGTGAIAISLASENPNWRITAVDVMPDAVALAKENAATLAPQVNVMQSHWFDAVADQRFDLIASNPPYIDETDPHLALGDVQFEPHSALTAADHGFADLFHIADFARKHLVNGGKLAMEHGFEQAMRLEQQLRALGYQDIHCIKDYGGNPRVTVATFKQ